MDSAPDLYEFLVEAELQQYYSSLKYAKVPLSVVKLQLLSNLTTIRCETFGSLERK
jgi:hypothetical protein